MMLDVLIAVGLLLGIIVIYVLVMLIMFHGFVKKEEQNGKDIQKILDIISRQEQNGEKKSNDTIITKDVTE